MIHRYLLPVWALVALVAVLSGPFIPQGQAAEVTSADQRLPGTSDSLSDEEQREYYELLKLLVDTLDQVERNYAQQVSRRELVEAAIQGVLSKLDDYSNYIAPEQLDEFEKDVMNEFGGIGIQIGMERDRLIVISPLVGTPAYRAGLMAGDRILRINDKPTRGITLPQAVDLLKGRAGTEVTVTVLHRDSPEPETVSLRRERIRIETVLGDRRGEDDSWQFMYDEQEKIAYIRVTAFSNRTAVDMRDALIELMDQGMRGLVLDLRFNPGGLLTSAVAVSDLFLAEGLIVSTDGRNVRKYEWNATADETFSDFPMAVMVNRYSASASEIVAACLQDHKRAAIVGQRTFGKGSVQQVVDLEGGRSALKLTTGSYRRPSGKNINRDEDASDEDDWGVRPDQELEVRLSFEEIGRLLRDRRLRDIVERNGTSSRNENGDAATEDQAESKSEDEQEAEAGADQPPFVDRQLQKALEYVRQQLAKTDETS